MTILFMGGEMSAFTPSGASAYEVTTAATFHESFARCSIFIDKAVDYVETSAYSTGTSLYCHFELAVRALTSGAGDNVRWAWLNGAGTQVIRLVQVYTGTVLRLDYWNGSAWVQVGSTIAVDMSIRQTIDISAVVNSASGDIKLYLSGTERIVSGVVDLSSITALGKMRFYGATLSSIGFASYVSQVMVADEPTIGWRLATFYPNGAGATSSWTGAFSDIDETTYSDADFINSASANQISTFAHTGPSVTGYSVRAVAVSARARRGASGPQNVRMALRSAGTDYFSGSDIALGVGYAPVQTIWETNPATSAAWVNTAVASVQPGAKSIA